MTHTIGLIIAAALFVALIVLVATLAITTANGRRAAKRDEPVDAARRADGTRLRAAVIVNPTKFADVAEVRGRVSRVCAEHGWAEPLWLETTVDDPGSGQARQALAEGVDLICPLGGDGTVRSVAAALIDSEIPLGLLPGGTGNLLARNLNLPVDSVERALHAALDGTDELIDVGTINVLVPGSTQDEEKDYYFLVMAGLGFDASVMADAPEKLKAQFGWPAYVVSGMKHLNGKRFDVDVRIDGAKAEHRRVRTVVVGNVGRLQGGVELMPEAAADDGRLDVVLLSPKGVLGWASVGAHFATRQRRGHPRVEHHRCRSISLQLEETQQVQLDGDPIGPGRALHFGVKPRCLKVRMG